MNETFEMIQKLANERFALYLLAGKQHLNPLEQGRLEEINNRLPMLWDQHRREIAGKRWSKPDYSAEIFRAA
jgi:hypothetical protein